MTILLKLEASACNFTKTVTPHQCFSRFLNCKNDIKSRKASHMIETFALNRLISPTNFSNKILTLTLRPRLFYHRDIGSKFFPRYLLIPQKMLWRLLKSPKDYLQFSFLILTHLTPKLPSFRNQSIDLLCISIDWFLYDGKFDV